MTRGGPDLNAYGWGPDETQRILGMSPRDVVIPCVCEHAPIPQRKRRKRCLAALAEPSRSFSCLLTIRVEVSGFSMADDVVAFEDAVQGHRT